MSWSSRKYPLGKTELHVHMKKASPYLTSLKYYLKALHSNIFKHFEISSESTVGMPWGSRNHPFRETDSLYCFYGCTLI